MMTVENGRGTQCSLKRGNKRRLLSDRREISPRRGRCIK